MTYPAHHPHRTSRAVVVNFHGAALQIPKGERLQSVQCGGGFYHYAVRSVARVCELGGDEHHACYRYAFVPDDCVEPAT